MYGLFFMFFYLEDESYLRKNQKGIYVIVILLQQLRFYVKGPTTLYMLCFQIGLSADGTLFLCHFSFPPYFVSQFH